MIISHRKKSGEARKQAGPEGKCYALPTGQAKRKNFCLPRSILSEAKDCYGARLPVRRPVRQNLGEGRRRTMGWERFRNSSRKRTIPLARGRQNRKILVSLIEKNLGAGE